MIILFSDEGLQLLCEDERRATRRLGRTSATRLQTRLRNIQAAANLGELVGGRLHPLRRDFEGCFALDLHGGHRLVIRPMDDPLPLLPDGGLNRQGVTIVRVEYIGDYHD